MSWTHPNERGQAQRIMTTKQVAYHREFSLCCPILRKYNAQIRCHGFESLTLIHRERHPNFYDTVDQPPPRHIEMRIVQSEVCNLCQCDAKYPDLSFAFRSHLHPQAEFLAQGS